MPERSPLDSYVQARAAASAGALDQASAGYAAALAASPDNNVIASQALGHAITASDWPLALAAARVLERGNAQVPDGRFLLLAEALRTRDWRGAGAQIDSIEREQVFSFTVPVLRAWLAFGSRQGEPLSFLPEAGEQGLAAQYAVEHRPLLMLAMGRPEGAEQLAGALASAGPRATRLRIAAAATLARRDRGAALALLEGNEAPIAAARRLIEERRPLPGAVATAPAGVAEFLVKVALDLHGQNLTPLAVTFAQLSTYLAPENSETWLVAAELLALQDLHQPAIAMLGNIRAGDPFAATARDQRVRLLVESGAREDALGEALASANTPSATLADWVRLGEVYAQLDRPAEAAEAFARAIAMRRPDDQGYQEWALWLLRGGALEQAGIWPEARTALEQAYRLAPEQPFVLNYLGYAQLERRENLVEAEALIREAHRLAPDSPAITDSLGWALYLKGDLAGAIDLLEKAAEGGPADTEINEHLGDAYFAAGRRIEARFAWRAALVYAEGEDAERLNAKIETGLTPTLAAR